MISADERELAVRGVDRESDAPREELERLVGGKPRQVAIQRPRHAWRAAFRREERDARTHGRLEDGRGRVVTATATAIETIETDSRTVVFVDVVVRVDDASRPRVVPG